MLPKHIPYIRCGVGWMLASCEGLSHVWRNVLSGGPGPSPLEEGAREGESPVVPRPYCTTRRCWRVGLFGNAALIGRVADGVSDVSWSDVEWCEPVCQSAWDIDRYRLWRWPKPGLLKCLWRRHCHDYEWQHASTRRVFVHLHAPGIGLWAPHLTHLEIRTKESGMCMSQRASKLVRRRKSAKWIRNLEKRIGSEGSARGSHSQTCRLSVDCSSCSRGESGLPRAGRGTDWERVFWGLFPGRRTVNLELVRTREIRLFN
ncbi:hypothetical protein RJT34_20695 [Clitoria ternatea]|uniref:Uncharacterized protein n=1 Tax=Clitoria ternatea TaxID=43366 RepID=A0AAN9IT82_CLITE